MQHRRRVGRVTDDDEVGIGRHRIRVQPEAVVLAQEHTVDRMPGGRERCFGLGELRVDDDDAPRGEGPGEQHESFGGAGGQQHLLLRSAVAGGDSGAGAGGVWIGGEVGEARG